MSSAQESVSHRGLTPHCLSALLNAWMLLNTVSCFTFLRISRERRKAFISHLISSNILGMTYLTQVLLVVVEKEESCKQIDISHKWVHRCKHHSTRDTATNISVMNTVILANKQALG